MAEVLAFCRPTTLGQCIEGPALTGQALCGRAGGAGLHPGGRWHRILAALAASGHPLTISALKRLTESGRWSGKVERRKIHRALRDMSRQELVAYVSPGWGLLPRGALAAAALDPAREAGRG